MKIARKLLLAVGVIMVLSLTSCVGSKEKKIQGQWERYNTTLDYFVVDTNKQEVWDFDNGDLTIYGRDTVNHTMYVIADLKYKMGLSKGKVAVHIQTKSDNTPTWIISTYVGEARIYMLKDDAFAMKGVETLIYYEFYR